MKITNIEISDFGVEETSVSYIPENDELERTVTVNHKFKGATNKFGKVLLELMGEDPDEID